MKHKNLTKAPYKTSFGIHKLLKLRRNKKYYETLGARLLPQKLKL